MAYVDSAKQTRNDTVIETRPQIQAKYLKDNSIIQGIEEQI